MTRARGEDLVKKGNGNDKRERSPTRVFGPNCFFEPEALSCQQMKSLSSRMIVALLLLLGFAFSQLITMPAPLTAADWNIFLLFFLTIVGVLWQPYPIGTIVIISLGLGCLTGILTLDQTLRGFSSSVTWIIIAAFLFARSFIKTGLGRRIALYFIRAIGSSSLRLGYALCLTDLVLAPVTASNTARSGGIIFPVARALALEFKSEPESSPRRIGAYLLFTAYQSNVVTSAMFLTAMAANALTVQFARDVAGVEITWILWMQAAIVPGLVSLAIVPWIIHRLYPPELRATPEAITYANRELKVLGDWDPQEKILAVVFLLLGGTWATSAFHGIPTVAAALTAVGVLLVLNVLEWEDVISEKRAWATLIWFGGFISLAGALTSSNLMTWLTANARVWLQGWNALAALILLIVAYTFLHYVFASMTAHIIALYAAFLAIALATGAPPMLAALGLCFFSNLYATLTHYGDGAAPVYYGSGYIEQKDWWIVGFLLALDHLVVWLGIGLPYWKLLGIW